MKKGMELSFKLLSSKIRYNKYLLKDTYDIKFNEYDNFGC